MGKFSNLTITEKGRMLLADVQAGGELDATRLVMGSGDIPAGKTPATMTAVVSEVISMQISSRERTPDGKVIFGGYYSNTALTTDFYFKEFALFARAIYRDDSGAIIRTTDEVLYSYGNAGSEADLIPAYTTGEAVEKQLEMVSYVGNETKVNLTIDSDIYVSKRVFDAHASRHAKGGEDAITPADIGAIPSDAGVRVEIPNGTDVKAFLANPTTPFGQFFQYSEDVPINAPLNDVKSWWFYDRSAAGVFARYAAQPGRLWWGGFNNGSFYGWFELITTGNRSLISPSDIGAVNKNGDTVNGNLNVNGALMVERSDNNRKARTVVHNNDDKEADFQNYTDDSNYVGIRLATEEKGVGDAAKVVQMKNGQFASFPILHTGNKEKIFTFGAEDLAAGISPLGTGQLHFVYE